MGYSLRRWYNGVHRHSAIRYVTPNERHEGRENKILGRRHELYQNYSIRQYVRTREDSTELN
jgi:putative transposase